MPRRKRRRITCLHTNCSKSSKTAYAVGNLNKHMLQTHVNCAEDCPGCKKSLATTLVKKLKEYTEIISFEELKRLEKKLYSILNADELPDCHDIGLIREKAIKKARKEEKRQQNASQAKTNKLDYFRNLKVTEIVHLVPKSLVRFLKKLLGTTDDENPHLLTCISVFLKTIRPNLVTPFNFKISSYISSMGQISNFKLTHKIGITTSYPYNCKIRRKAVEKVDQLLLEAKAGAKDNDILVTFDNVQKGIGSSTVGANSKKKIKICTAAIIWRLAETKKSANKVQSENEVQIQSNLCVQKNNTYKFNLETLSKKPNILLTEEEKRKKILFMYEDFVQDNAGKAGTKGITTILENTRHKELLQNTICLPAFDVNPASIAETEKFLDQIKETLLESDREHLFLGCDGSPYLIIRDIQIKKKSYLEFHLVSGVLHEEINFMKAFASLLDSVGILDQACNKLHQNTTQVLNIKDTHKSRAVLHTTSRSLERALAEYIGNSFLNSFTSKWPSNISRIRTSKFINFLKTIIEMGRGIILFYKSVRRANMERLMLARKILFPLLFGFKHYKYARIVADTFCTWENAKKHEKFAEKLINATFMSISGNPDCFQGSDALQEEYNRLLKRHVSSAGYDVSC